MSEKDSQEITEDTGGGTGLPQTKGKSRKAFENIRRQLSDEELSSPATQRLLIAEIDRLEEENGNLRDIQNSYHAADKRAAVLDEKLKTNIAQDVIFGGCLTVGAALIGLTPSLWSTGKSYGWILLTLGVSLITVGIASKVVKR